MGDISVRIQVDGKFPDRQRLNEPSNLVPTYSIDRNSYDFGPAVTGSLAQYVERGEFGFAAAHHAAQKFRSSRRPMNVVRSTDPPARLNIRAEGSILCGEITVN